jgi:hypothetical protein
MSILIGFLPFLVFALANAWLGATTGLALGAAMSGWRLVSARRRGQSPKILEGGTCILFLALLAYTALAGRSMSIIGIRLAVDIGLFAIVLVSLLARRPFTLQYAREQVPSAYWQSPSFVRTNYLLSTVWLVAFLVMVLAEAALVLRPELPRKEGIAVVAAAMLGAFGFTAWYPRRAAGGRAGTSPSVSGASS